MRKVVALLSLCLAACATPADLRSRAPQFEGDSDAPVERVAGCIGDRFEASPVASQGSISSRPATNGYSISVAQSLPGGYGGGNDTIILVDVNRAGPRTHVQVYTHFLGGDGGIPQIVRGCL